MNIVSHILFQTFIACVCFLSASHSVSAATHHFEKMRKKGWTNKRFLYFLVWTFQTTGLISLGISLLIMNKEMTRFCMLALAVSTSALSTTPCSIPFFRTKIGKVIRTVMLFAGATMYIYTSQIIT